MNFEQQWLEYDYNPFIVFNENGKIISANSEAQFLLGAITPSTLFELAKVYASINFGFKTTFIELEYGRYKFFGVTVGYKNEEQIGIKLYQSPSFKLNTQKPEGELTNIFTITDLCIATNSISSSITYTKSYDPTIPEIIVNSNKLIKVLNKMYDCVEENETIDTKVFYSTLVCTNYAFLNLLLYSSRILSILLFEVAISFNISLHSAYVFSFT